MKEALHTILGASGAMGKAVLDELKERKLTYRTVSRTEDPSSSRHATVANLLNKSEAKQAMQGSSFVCLCIGLPYNYRIWKRDWPTIMQNTIDACIEHNAKLNFLDNVYM